MANRNVRPSLRGGQPAGVAIRSAADRVVAADQEAIRPLLLLIGSQLLLLRFFPHPSGSTLQTCRSSEAMSRGTLVTASARCHHTPQLAGSARITTSPRDGVATTRPAPLTAGVLTPVSINGWQQLHYTTTPCEPKSNKVLSGVMRAQWSNTVGLGNQISSTLILVDREFIRDNDGRKPQSGRGVFRLRRYPRHDARFAHVLEQFHTLPRWWFPVGIAVCTVQHVDSASLSTLVTSFGNWW